MRCRSGKRSYVNLGQAEEALLQAHVQFDYRAGGGPVNVYRCDDCGAYHLTSQGVMNTQLREALANGTIQKLKTARDWDDRFKIR